MENLPEFASFLHESVVLWNFVIVNVMSILTWVAIRGRYVSRERFLKYVHGDCVQVFIMNRTGKSIFFCYD